MHSNCCEDNRPHGCLHGRGQSVTTYALHANSARETSFENQNTTCRLASRMEISTRTRRSILRSWLFLDGIFRKMLRSLHPSPVSCAFIRAWVASVDKVVLGPGVPTIRCLRSERRSQRVLFVCRKMRRACGCPWKRDPMWKSRSYNGLSRDLSVDHSSCSMTPLAHCDLHWILRARSSRSQPSYIRGS